MKSYPNNFWLRSFAVTIVSVLLSLQNVVQASDSKYFLNEKFEKVELSEFTVNFLHRGQGQPLLLLHGGGEWSYTFRHNIDALSPFQSHR